ncbi:MAG: 4Fe-4S binding protein [Saprospiraceae bacterium]|nr:4Fe-4S binding protein [Saprospiraceae bacterium]
MEDARAIFGKTLSLSSKEAARVVELGVGEAFLSAESASREGMLNIFGRTADHLSGVDLSAVKGIIATGIRGGAHMTNGQLLDNLSVLQELVRNHLPTLIYLDDKANPVQAENNRQLGYFAASELGCFQLYASNAQELVDLALISHKVSELALVPGILGIELAYETDTPQFMQLPGVRELRTFIGSPDDTIKSRTPAQQMLFGATRRRVPNWFNPDMPLLIDVPKDQWSLDLEWAAQQQFFARHLANLLDDVRAQYAALSGRIYKALKTYKAEDAEYLVVVQGTSFWPLIKIVDELRSSQKVKVGVIHLAQLRPLPLEELARVIDGRKGVTIMDTVAAAASEIGPIHREVLSTLAVMSEPPALYQGFYRSGLGEEEARVIFDNMLLKNERRKLFYTGLSFSRSSSGHPQQEVMLQHITRDYPGLEDLAIGKSEGEQEMGEVKRTDHAVVPTAINKVGDQGPPLSRVSRFFRDTIHFYEYGHPGDLVADPFQSLPIAPMVTNSFASVSETRERFPIHQPEKCSGCGQCQIYCPQVAIPSLATNLENLLRGAQKIAVQQHKSVGKLTPFIKNLAATCVDILGQTSEQISSVRDFLPEAFENLIAQSQMEGDRLVQTKAEFENFLEVIGGFAVSVTDTFFPRGELLLQPSSDLFALAINPDACTGCNICVEVCPDEAFVMEKEDEQLLQGSQAQFDLLSQMPPTSNDIIQRKVEDSTHDAWAACMLDREIYENLVPGRTAEKGLSSVVVLHAVVSNIQAIYQPLTKNLEEQLSQLSEALSKNIHDEMSSAIPQGDSTLLKKVLEKSKGERLPLDEVIGNLDQSDHLSLVDTAALRRKLELFEDLKQLRWLIEEGPSGLGRSNYTLAMYQDGTNCWPLEYPWNPFYTPALVVKSSHTLAQVAGLVTGCLRHFTDNIKLLRRAELEINGKYRPEIHAQEIADLKWEQMNEQEKSLAPLTLLVVEDRQVAGLNLQTLQSLLHSEWPVKILIMDECSVGRQADGVDHFFRTWPLTASVLASRRSQYLQGSLDRSSYLFEGMRELLVSRNPAILHFATPGQSCRSINLPAYLDLAQKTRAFPTFSFRPDPKRQLISSCLDLEGNPSPDLKWYRETIPYKKDGADTDIDYVWTYADWLFHQEGWQDSFQLMEKQEPNHVTVPDYLTLDPNSRASAQPVIFYVDPQGHLESWSVAEPVIRLTEIALKKWNMLRELAGYLTDDPEKLWKKVEEEFSKKLQIAKTEMREAFEQKEKGIEKQLMERVRNQLRDKLLMISEKGKERKE